MRRFLCLTLSAFLLSGCAEGEDQDGAEALHEDVGAAVVAGSMVSDADREAVTVAVQRVFDALEAGDEALLRSILDPQIMMRFWEESADGTASRGASDLDGLSQRITTSEVPLIERMWDPEVRVSGALASLWAPYDFYAGEAFSHCGVDQVTLMRGEDGEWTIIALNWTRQQPPACELHPEGPPAA